MNPKTNNCHTEHFREQSEQSTFHSILTLFLIVSSSFLFAQGPNAPEAASFEPVDVTDAVNLVTGDFTYAIPILEVPGPEGGYPISLSYHAGIAMDQEASWVGLGWSLNPGAINRTVNGYPDDWLDVKSHDYFWDSGGGGEQRTVDINIPLGPSGVTVGLGVSWGSLRGFSGSVGMGLVGIKGIANVGFDVGSDGFGLNAGIGPKGGNVGVNANVNFSRTSGVSGGIGVGTRGTKIGASVGIQLQEGQGATGYAALKFNTAKGNNSGINGSIGLTTSGAITYSLGASLASNDDSKPSMSAGTGGSTFSTTRTQDDVTTKHSGYTIPLIVVSYRYEKVKWYVDVGKNLNVYGALYADNSALNVPQSVVEFCKEKYGFCCGDQPSSTPCRCLENPENYGYTGETLNPEYTFNDVKEVNYNGSDDFSILNANPALLNFDQYNVSAQGLSGSMTPKFMKNMSLFNVNHDLDLGTLSYFKPDDDNDKVVPNFYFDNELVGGLLVNKVDFSDVSNPSNFQSYINNPSQVFSGNKKAGNFVEFFTYANLPSNNMMPEGYVKPEHVNDSSIAGFRITSKDGIVYHYMLPVYNFLDITQSFSDHNTEKFSRSSKSPYATHWLLTSITGPDYVDKNSNGRLDESDYGYWVSFDYGRWSKGNPWRFPNERNTYNKFYKTQTTENYSYGMKELYYLNKISTRTHSALFVKSLRNDDDIEFDYDYKGNVAGTFQKQQKLKLDKIVLVKNSELDNYTTNNGEDTFLNSISDRVGFGGFNIYLNQQNNVLDIKDYEKLDLTKKAIGGVDFGYDYSLASGTPNGNRLALKSIQIKGKKGTALTPPYGFKYSNNPYWSRDKGNYWGYYHQNASAWSLDEITTPIGTIMTIEYEDDQYYTDKGEYTGRNNIVKQSYFLWDKIIEFDVTKERGVYIEADNYNFRAGDTLRMKLHREFVEDIPCDEGDFKTIDYDGLVTLYNAGSNKFYGRRFGVTMLDEPEITIETLHLQDGQDPCDDTFISSSVTFYNVPGQKIKPKTSSGIRVKALSTSDGIDTFTTSYEYDGGTVPYEPFYDSNEVSNMTMLRAPIVFYNKVTVRQHDKNGNLINNVKDEYEFFNDFTNYSIEEGTNYTGSKLQTNIDADRLKSFNNYLTDAVIYEYKDYQGIVGNLKSHSVHQEDKLLAQTNNNYKFLNESSGLLNREAYQMYKTSTNVIPKYVDYNVNRLISTTYTNYPAVLDNVETIKGGLRTITYSRGRDVKSGELLETHFYDSDGSIHKTKIVPAYTEYADMGSKADNINNKNMLAQVTGQYSYFKKNGVWQPTAAGITTWNNDWKYIFNDGSTETSIGIWRKHKTYTYNGQRDDGGVYANFNDFNYATNATNTNWKQLKEITKYNQFSKSLESKDINNNYVSTKMDKYYQKVISYSDAAYTEQFFSGAEDASNGWGGGQVSVANYTSEKAHTGTYSEKASTSSQSFKCIVKPILKDEQNSKQFKISVWVHKDNYTSARLFNGTSVVSFTGEKVFAGNWVQLNHYIGLSTTKTIYLRSASGSVYFDDFRIHPISSSMSNYVYNDWDELSYIIGPNGLATHYVYDDIGRLVETYAETIDKVSEDGSGGFKKMSSNSYNYQNQ